MEFFAVEEGLAEKLEAIVSDPVNRQGIDYEDEQGSYSYYTGEDGVVDDVDDLRNVEYEVLEIPSSELVQDDELECPEITEEVSEEDLRQSCIFCGDDGTCSKLGVQCVVTDD